MEAPRSAERLLGVCTSEYLIPSLSFVRGEKKADAKRIALFCSLSEAEREEEPRNGTATRYQVVVLLIMIIAALVILVVVVVVPMLLLYGFAIALTRKLSKSGILAFLEVAFFDGAGIRGSYAEEHRSVDRNEDLRGLFLGSFVLSGHIRASFPKVHFELRELECLRMVSADLYKTF